MNQIEKVEKTLKNAGFDVEIRGMGFLVSLNRPINTMEVQSVFNFDNSIKTSRIGKKVLVTI